MLVGRTVSYALTLIPMNLPLRESCVHEADGAWAQQAPPAPSSWPSLLFQRRGVLHLSGVPQLPGRSDVSEASF